MSTDLSVRVSRSIYFWLVIASIPMSLCSVTDGATVATESNVLLNQSPSDALQGLIGNISAGASIPVGSVSGLTNASTASAPADLQYLNPDSTATITYDFGEASAATRELASVSIWLHAGDGHRVDYAGGVAVSSDNVSYTSVASTNRVEFTSGAPPQSHVLYSFAAQEVMGFRYLQIRDEAVFQDQGTTFGTGPYHPWIIEIDAFLASLDVPGDYNNNGTVNAADYVLWRKNPGGFPADAYDTWRANFGQTSGSGAGAASNATVPEPATLMMLVVVAVGVRLHSRHIGARVPRSRSHVTDSAVYRPFFETQSRVSCAANCALRTNRPESPSARCSLTAPHLCTQCCAEVCLGRFDRRAAHLFRSAPRLAVFRSQASGAGQK